MLNLRRISAMLILSTISIQSLAVCGETAVSQNNVLYITQANPVQFPAMNNIDFRATTGQKDEREKQKMRNVIILIITGVVMASMAVTFAVRN